MSDVVYSALPDRRSRLGRSDRGEYEMKAKIKRCYTHPYWDTNQFGEDYQEPGYYSWCVYINNTWYGSFDEWRRAFDWAFEKVTHHLRLDRALKQTLDRGCCGGQ